jgi:predicted ribosomally synthesized peptide with SipW-like signal peptide
MNQDSERGRRIGSSLAVLAIAASALAIAGTGAIFTDTQSVAGNSFGTGTVDISTAPTSNILSVLSGMAPGDLATGTITVTNSGSLQMRYSVRASATNDDTKNLRGSLSLRVGLRGGGSCDFPYFTLTGATTTLTDDTQLYSGAFPTSATPTNLIGDVAQGSQDGDQELNAAASEVLCVAIVLPTSALNGVQGASTTATFDFDAEQTKNN